MIKEMNDQMFGENVTRDGISPNPADVRTTRSIMQLGSTTCGRMAAVKILHPCIETGNCTVKYPDGAVSTSVTMERRDEYSVSSPFGVDKNWDCVAIHLPFLNARSALVFYDATDPPSLSLLRDAARFVIVDNNNADITYPNISFYGSYTNVAVSLLTSATLTPSILGDAGALGALVKNLRRTAFGITTDFDAPTLADQGRVVSGQWNPDVALGTIEVKDTSSDTNTITDVYDLYKMQLPAIELQAIVSSDEFCREALAKTGSYMPIRPCTPEVNMTSAQEYREIDVIFPGDSRDSEFVPETNYDLWLRGWSVGVEHWSGIGPNTNLRFKIRECLELVCAPDSIYSPFATPGYPDDVRAKSVIREFCRTEPHAYQASFNSLGTMLKKIVSTVGGLLGNLGLPVISPIAKGAANVANSSLGNTLAGILDRL